jgi:O-antigen/teichoic acid export membrane protein
MGGFIVLGEPILHYWMGSKFDYQTAYHILIVLLLGRMSALAANAFTTALLATSQHKLTAKISFSETCLSGLLLALGLATYDLGAVFAAYAIAIPLLIGRIILLPALALRILGIERSLSLLAISFRPLLLVPVVYLLDLSLNKDTPELTWHLASTAAASLIAGGSFFMFDPSVRERILAKRIMPRFLRKSKA